MHTRNQLWSQLAYEYVCVIKGKDAEVRDKYSTFSKSFPALLHSSGLAQAVAYAHAKNLDYISDLAKVLGHNSVDELTHAAREVPVSQYQQVSRDALHAATWLKRYAEALLSEEK